jgi:kinetochore protein Mis12/MTW1
MGGQTITQVAGGSQQRTNPTPPLLLPEILGFSPQLLLDDIINISNNAVQDGVNGMEEFLQKWADERAARQGGDWDSTQEVEQGLVAFQTLLEYHTDIAFDFFEAWSLRNIFAIPNGVGEKGLPVVVPHQEGLDLTCTLEREQELMDECDELRRKIDNVRILFSFDFLPIS